MGHSHCATIIAIANLVAKNLSIDDSIPVIDIYGYMYVNKKANSGDIEQYNGKDDVHVCCDIQY